MGNQDTQTTLPRQGGGPFGVEDKESLTLKDENTEKEKHTLKR